MGVNGIQPQHQGGLGSMTEDGPLSLIFGMDRKAEAEHGFWLAAPASRAGVTVTVAGVI